MTKLKSRSEAGKILADRLSKEIGPGKLDKVLVIALPRGGIPVAREVALRMNVPMDVLVVRKIGSPRDPEYGIGAITESGYFWINPDAVDSDRGAEELERSIGTELEQARLGAELYRGGRSLPDLGGKTVILIDDGIATGGTAVVAIRYLRSQGASRIIVAAPVCARDAIDLLAREADQVVCARKPDIFSSVGSWYEDFSQVTNEEVTRTVEELRRRKNRDSEDVELPGDLVFPRNRSEKEPRGAVIFAHGSGSSRFSPRNRHVAQHLNDAGFATLLFDLLTPSEAANRERVFDIPFLATRLAAATERVEGTLGTRSFGYEIPIGYFGASTGAAAALWAAADPGSRVRAIVSRGGRPDLASSRLKEVRAETLLIVGSLDHPVIEMNGRALHELASAEMKLVPGATHLFEEPGALDQVSRLAIRWFEEHLAGHRQSSSNRIKKQG